MQQDFERVFEKCDCLLAPTGSGIACCDPAADLSATCDVAANLAGLPSLSLPFGLVDGLPVGLQFMARHFDEEVLLRVGYTWQENTKHKNKP